MLEVCYDERRNYWQDDHEPNGLNGDTLWLVGASICDGRCSGLFQMDISVGVSCSEIRLNGNVVLSDMCPATVVYELVELDRNMAAERMSVEVEGNNLELNAWRISSWWMELARDLHVSCSATTAQQDRRPVEAVVGCEPSRDGDVDDGGDDGGNEQVVRGWGLGPCVQMLSEGGGYAMWKDMVRGLDQRVQWATVIAYYHALCFCLENHVHVARALFRCLPWGKDINSSPTANAATETALKPTRQ